MWKYLAKMLPAPAWGRVAWYSRHVAPNDKDMALFDDGGHITLPNIPSKIHALAFKEDSCWSDLLGKSD